MITIHNEGQYRDALLELSKIFQDDTSYDVDSQYYNHLVEAIMEWEDINYPMEDE